MAVPGSYIKRLNTKAGLNREAGAMHGKAATEAGQSSRVSLQANSRSRSSQPVYADVLAELAREALIAEAELTPKPGLVDRRGSGAHCDLSLSLMHQSAFTLEPHYREIALFMNQRSIAAETFEQLKRIGLAAEEAMFRATNGSNTHKGAIWSLGLLTASASCLYSSSPITALDLAATAGGIARFHEIDPAVPVTHGCAVEQQFAVTGARGEAQQGFPHVINIGLPTLRRRRTEGATEEVARLDCLFAIMSTLADTCLLYRGGTLALETARSGARSIINAGGTGTASGVTKLYELDEQLRSLKCSPGGSADLLAATLFIDAIERNSTGIQSTSTH
jgi:triphosphoribosyl-dephospho-CoA synthase